MPFDPTKPVALTEIDANLLRNQYNGLKDLIDAQAAVIAGLQNQVAAQAAQLGPIAPQLNRDDSGTWSLTYMGQGVAFWQIWLRSGFNPDWAPGTAYDPGSFPTADGDILPAGASWCQVKVVGKNGDGYYLTPFSDVVSVGAVPP